jgi:hypothetical protein
MYVLLNVTFSLLKLWYAKILASNRRTGGKCQRRRLRAPSSALRPWPLPVARGSVHLVAEYVGHWRPWDLGMPLTLQAHTLRQSGSVAPAGRPGSKGELTRDPTIWHRSRASTEDEGTASWTGHHDNMSTKCTMRQK